jgi:hypothetical protein
MYQIDYNETLAEKHYKTVKQKIQNRAKNFIANKSYSVNKVKYTADINTKNYLNQLLDDSYLEKLITGRPEDLRVIIQNIDQNALNYPKDKPKKPTKLELQTNHNLNRILYYIFVIDVYDKMDKTQFVENMNIKTCPYCNRGYIHVVTKEISGKTVKPQIDHFFPKSKYPFLAASYYNLIPSCLQCNGFDCKEQQSPISNDADPTNSQLIRNPYEFNDHELIFGYDISNTQSNPIDIFSLTLNNLELTFNGNNDLWNGYEKIFALKSLYKTHKDFVLELILKLNYLYNQASIDNLSLYTNDNITTEKIIDFFWGFPLDKKEAKNRILTKYLNDILDKTKEYKNKGEFRTNPIH